MCPSYLLFKLDVYQSRISPNRLARVYAVLSVTFECFSLYLIPLYFTLYINMLNAVTQVFPVIVLHLRTFGGPASGSLRNSFPYL